MKMSTASQYQHVFRINKPEDSTNNGGQTQINRARRNRQPLSCDACRMRKLKCDRQHPCSPCSKRGEPASTSCYYSQIQKDRDRSLTTTANSTKSEAQLRLQKLEEMVTGLMQAASSNGTNDASSSNPPTVSVGMKDIAVSPQSSSEHSGSISNGHLDTDGLESHYRGATHWTTILENIQDIRGLVDSAAEPVDEFQPSHLPDAPEIVLGTTQLLNMDDFLDALPPRTTVDNLVSAYLTSDSIRAPHIHSRKFLREYRTFWKDPYSTSFLWVSMLFSILWISSYLGPLDAAQAVSHISFFTKAGQALVAGGYHKARPYSADATLLYALCSFYASKQGGNTDCWLMMGIATRLAVKMGYHRDPKQLFDISPFEGEMRRRCFFTLDAFDVLLSNQFGLPTILQEEDCDTEAPRNLHDDDFDEDCKVLPPSRPSTEVTPMLYHCYKSRFAKAHKRAIRHALTIETTSYDETLKLDAELHANDADVPPSLQMTSLDDLLLDQPWQTLRRMHIKFQYLRSLCVLHRKYLNQGRTNPKFAYSRGVCTDASIQILKIQADLYFATRPGGRYEDNRLMLCMLTQHHSLLAAMIICLDMYESHDQQTLSSPEDLAAQAAKYDALRISLDVWMSRRHFSRDAQRASNIVANILSRVPRPDVPISAAENVSTTRSGPFQLSYNNEDLPDLMGASMNDSSYPNNPNLFTQLPAVEDLSVLPYDATDPVNLIFDGTENIDWDVLDQYLVDGRGSSQEAGDWQMQGFSEPAPIT